MHYNIYLFSNGESNQEHKMKILYKDKHTVLPLSTNYDIANDSTVKRKLVYFTNKLKFLGLMQTKMIPDIWVK